MSRPILFIAAREPVIATALYQFLNLFARGDEFLHSVRQVNFNCPAELFEQLDKLSPEELFNTMVILDLSGEDSEVWNVIRMKGKRGLAAHLVLAYPEVYFVFLGGSSQLLSILPSEETLRRCENSNNKRSVRLKAEAKATQTALAQYASLKLNIAEMPQILKQHHFVENNNFFCILNLIRLHALGFRTLFDPTGLRSFLKYRLLKNLKRNLPDVLAGIYRKFSYERLKFAAVVTEEESSFLYFNGYAAYKFGFRTWLAHTLGEFLRLLEDEQTSDKSKWSSANVAAQRKFEIAMLDWHLVYRDDEDTTGKEVGAVRKKALERGDISHPIIITSFPQNLGMEISKAVILQKPYGGFFELLQKQPKPGTSPAETFRNECKAVYEKVWRDVKNELNQRSKKRSGNLKPPSHSAPYACSTIAERLLARANAIKTSEPVATEYWIQVALLAGEAKEILGGLSLTTTYQAIALQHEAEVRAEVSFLGMSTEIEVNHRLKDLCEEIEGVQKAAIGVAGAEKSQERISKIGRLNCILSIIHNLRLRFIAHEQIRAAEHCLCAFVEHHRKFKSLTNWASDAKFLKKLRIWILSWFSWYLDFATKAGTSVTRLALCSAGLIFAFFVLNSFLFYHHPGMKQNLTDSAVMAAGHSMFTFIELQPGVNETENMRQESMAEPKAETFVIEFPSVDAKVSAIVKRDKGTSEDNPEPTLCEHQAWFAAYWILLFFELGLAYVHTGLLVSVLYRRITKRAP